MQNNLALYSVLFHLGHICCWDHDQCVIYILYSSRSTKFRHSHQFVAMVIQFLIPFVD